MISSYFVCDAQIHCDAESDEELCNTTNYITPSNLCYHPSSWDVQHQLSLCPNYTMKFNQNISCGKASLQTFSMSLKSKIPSELNATPKSESYCLYELDDCGHLTIHKYGQHLADCEDVICHTKYFKCPKYYCLPFRYVCNGLWECPGGVEENNCHTVNCSGLFKCVHSVICISPASLCDGIIDCPHGDDTEFCDKKLPICPNSCNWNLRLPQSQNCLLRSPFLKDSPFCEGCMKVKSKGMHRESDRHIHVISSSIE